MIDPASGWFEVVQLPTEILLGDSVASDKNGLKGKQTPENDPYFDKSLQNWLTRPGLADIHVVVTLSTITERKPTSVKNPQGNAILERIHQTFAVMMRTAELDMADSVDESDIEDFLDNASWALRSTYHTVLKASPGAAIFGRDMMFDVPFLADWNKIGDYRQRQTDRNTARENKARVDWDYKVGDKVLLRKEGILRKSETKWQKAPWTIVQVHTNAER
eukprot:scaffold66238_cov43-Cyclotella_meneghiniana.AAC.10